MMKRGFSSGLKKKWRNAASLILTQRDPKPASAFDYRLLMLKRSGASKFMANAMVFPGGVADKPDFSSEWLELLDGVENPPRATDSLCLGLGTPRPLLVSAGHEETAQGIGIGPDLGYRICAIRETFEESGVLISRPPSGERKVVPGSQLEEARQRVRKDPSAFISVCKALGLCPDVWSLYEWSCWLTPLNIPGGRRFDTIFYTCVVEGDVDVTMDDEEVTTYHWAGPPTILDGAAAEAAWLPPPQLYEVSRMRNFPKLDDLKSFAAERERRGCVTWLPVLFKCKDGTIAAYPGDDIYPTNPDYYGNHDPPELDESLRSNNQNRLKRSNTLQHCLSCNVEDPHGHLPPVLN